MNLSRAMDMGEASVSAAVATARPELTPVRPTPSVFAQPLIPIGTAIVVALLTMVMIRLGDAGDNTAVFWAANAVAAGIWLRTGRGLAFDLSFGGLMAVGIAVGEIFAGHSPLSALLMTGCNLAEILTAVILVRRFAPSLAIVSVRTAIRLMAALIASAMVGAVVGSVCLYLIFDTPIVNSMQVWAFGHALGLIVVTPLLLSFNRQTLSRFSQPMRLLEAAALLGLTVAAAYLLSFRVNVPLAFLINPLLLVIAVRMRINGLSLAMTAVCVCVLGAILHGHGPASTATLETQTRIVMAQLMLAFAYVPYLMVSALIEERDRLWLQAKAGLARAERASEAKSRLLANVAHEIKSPVAGVIGIGELWSSGQLGAVTATQTEMAGMLVKTARQVETLAHDLLDVARAEAGTVKVEARPTEIVSLVEDVRRAALLRSEARGVTVSVESESPSHVALVDSQRLRQVIENLAVNALKYGGSGGRLDLRVKSCALGVRIEVADLGPGLSPGKQAQLFEPFNRLGLERSTIEGHGVGLALARRLVELQGGEIGVISAAGEGATFWVEVPAA